MAKKEQIYIDYLIAKVLGEKVQSVADKHKCSRDWVYQKVREIESEIDDVHLHRYKTITKYLGNKISTKRDKMIQVALIRNMYKNKYTVAKIAKYTGKTANNIQIIIFG